MGCYNMQCTGTMANVCHGDDVVVLFRVTGCYHKPGSQEFYPPVYAKYNDYGWIEDIEEREETQWALACIQKFLAQKVYQEEDKSRRSISAELKAKEPLDLTWDDVHDLSRADRLVNRNGWKLEFSFVHRSFYESIASTYKDIPITWYKEDEKLYDYVLAANVRIIDLVNKREGIPEWKMQILQNVAEMFDSYASFEDERYYNERNITAVHYSQGAYTFSSPEFVADVTCKLTAFERYMYAHHIPVTCESTDQEYHYKDTIAWHKKCLEVLSELQATRDARQAAFWGEDEDDEEYDG